MEIQELETAASICKTNLKKETIVNASAQRQREYRRRKKIEKQLLNPKKIPKTNAQNQQKFRQKLKQQSETFILARRKDDAERKKRYRERLKLKKQCAKLNSLPSSKGDSLLRVLIENKKEIDHSHVTNCEELIVSQCQMQTNQIQPSINEPQQIISPNFQAPYEKHDTCSMPNALLCHQTNIAGDDVPETTTTNANFTEGEKKMSEHILAVLDHFKQPDPVGLPGANIPDPYPVPDMKQSLSFATLYFKNTALYGIRKFRIIYVNAEIGAMEVRASMVIDKLQARGNYTMLTWLQKQQGPFTVDIESLKIIAHATLGVERDGKIRAQDINIDLAFENIAVDFENLGFFGAMFQGIINSVGTFIFDSIKPYILKEAYTKARAEINNKLEEVAGDIQFPNSISPLDMVVADVRKKVRDMGMDPYKVKDYNATVSIFGVTLSNTWVTGVSSFQRVGNITLKMEKNTAIADFEIGTQKLDGRTQWDISAVGGLMSRAGTASFSVEYISGRIILAQPLDTREKPECRGLDLEVGNIQVRCNGAGTLDYVIEFVVNILPNLLRYQIMDALEGPIKEKMQQELDKINVEEMIKQELPKIDEMSEKGFKLSSLIDTQIKDEKYDEDEFFNF